MLPGWLYWWNGGQVAVLETAGVELAIELLEHGEPPEFARHLAPHERHLDPAVA